MISRWLTSFSLLVGLWQAGAVAATVTGQVTLIADSHTHATAPGTVVWLSPLSAPVPEVADRTKLHARMVQKDKHFEPHILPVEIGTLVDFPNLDPIFHNAFSNFEGQLFDIGLYPPGSSRAIRFRREGVVRVFCNIHPAMSAVIVVVATPFFTVTDKGGHFSMANVPEGEYQLHFFQEQATTETLNALTRVLAVNGPVTTVEEVKLSEAGYIPTPHKNKYGRDYAPDSPGMYH